MNVALSRHVASLMQQEPLRSLEFARRRELATAVDRVDDASQLPEWIAQLIAEAEANAHEQEGRAMDLSFRYFFRGHASRE